MKPSGLLGFGITAAALHTHTHIHTYNQICSYAVTNKQQHTNACAGEDETTVMFTSNSLRTSEEVADLIVSLTSSLRFQDTPIQVDRTCSWMPEIAFWSRSKYGLERDFEYVQHTLRGHVCLCAEHMNILREALICNKL